MVADNGKFRVSAMMIEYLRASRLALRDQRFLLATIHFQHLLGDWPSIDWGAARDQEHWMPLKAHRSLGCAPRSNDARSFQAVTEFWQEERVLFDDIALTQDHRHVRWRFSEFSFAMMSEMDRYALLIAERLKTPRTDLDMDVFLQVVLHHKMQRPEFRILDQGFQGRGEEPVPFKLKDVDRKLMSSLQRLADLTGYRFVVGYLQEGKAPGYTSVAIRIQHEKTKWPSGRIDKFPPRTRQFSLAPEAGEAQQSLQMKA
ncbi:hypothetical protein [Cribrihabitans pelagius]|uniref:hypothetical protein n=1 Tax=Cribrihabitans pelagius TaxID=1765746 RepID=UPI003B5AD296